MKSKTMKSKQSRCHGLHAHELGARLQNAYLELKRARLKRTPHREKLIEFLVKNHGPFSKEEIQKNLSKNFHDEMDGVTLYRNLSGLEKIGLLRRSEFGDGISRYEFQESTQLHHHHVVCTSCKKVDSLDSCTLKEIESPVAQMGYTQIRHSLEFFGICRDCQKPKNIRKRNKIAVASKPRFSP